MKIAFYSGKNNKNHAAQLIELLEGQAPHHTYNHHASGVNADLWHCVAPSSSLGFMARAHRSVVSLSDLRFLLSPEIYALRERLFLLPLYRYHCRRAARIIALSNGAKRRVVDALGLDEQRVEVCPPIEGRYRLSDQDALPSSEELLHTRSLFGLEESFLLVMGEMDTMHCHTTILHAILAQPHPLGVVVIGRRTTHADVLLQMVRDRGAGERVQFIYECSAEQLAAIYRMALCIIYMPAFEASISPIVEGLRLRVPMILSSTPHNREAAGAAATYVAPYDEQALERVLRQMIYNESYRGQLIAQCWAESRRYSDEALAEQLSKIYESV